MRSRSKSRSKRCSSRQARPTDTHDQWPTVPRGAVDALAWAYPRDGSGNSVALSARRRSVTVSVPFAVPVRTGRSADCQTAVSYCRL